ncbi:MAG: hypothetical protein HDQ97_14440 [Lachnospiraceae bacterium]|nr:hypothetical protein [Lachnospiraceae bacterium]
MKRQVIGSAAALLTAALATGCGNTIPNLSDQQQELVVEYAAGIVLKYDQNYESKLVELTLEQETEMTAPEEEVSENPVTDEKESADAQQQEDALEDVTVIDNTQEQEDVSIESFLNLDSVKITYAGCEAYDFYPEQGEEEEFYFVMNATEGNKLLVLKFLTENISGAETSLDIGQSETRFTLMVNGERKNALTTMLLNELAYYQGTLAPGESTELVLICEIPDEQADATPTLELTMKSVDDIATISLN